MVNVKDKKTILLLLAVVSCIFAVVSFFDARLKFQGKKFDLNEASLSDFSESSLAEGEAYLVTGPFASLTEKQTAYGIPIGKKKTYYYLIGSIDSYAFEDAINSSTDNIFNDVVWYVASASDKELVDDLDKAADRMDRWLQGYINLVNFFQEHEYEDSDQAKIDQVMDNLPTKSVHIGGILKTQSNNSQYKKYRDDFLAEGGLKSSDIGEMMLVTTKEGGEPGMSEVLIFCGASAVFVLCTALLIASSLKKRKAKKEEELW